MKQISEEQFRKLRFKKRKGLSNELSKSLLELEVGGHLFLARSEWKLNSEPGSLIYNAQNYFKSPLRGTRFSIKQLEDNSGWIITRRVNLENLPETDTGYRCSLCKEMFETRKGARQHLKEFHKGEFGRVMYLIAGKREPSDKWLKYKNRKRFKLF